MEDRKVEIQSIKIKVGGKEIELTVGEARDLKKKLEDLLGSVNSQYWYYTPSYIPYIPYVQPSYIPYTTPNKPLEYEVTWSSYPGEALSGTVTGQGLK